MEKKDKQADNPGPPKPTSVERDIFRLERRQDQIEEFTLETRKLVVMSQQSLPYINYQFEQVLADRFGLRQSLLDVQKEVSLRHASYEDAMRDRSRLSERAAFLIRYVDSALAHYRAQADKVVLLEGNVEKLEKELEAKNTIIKAVDGVVDAVREMIEQKKLPPDVLAQLKGLLAELPQPIQPQPPQPAEKMEEEL